MLPSIPGGTRMRTRWIRSDGCGVTSSCMRRILFPLLVVVAFVAAFPVLAFAQTAVEGDDAPSDQDDAIMVAGVRGPLEQRALDFLTAVVATGDARVIILHVDNPGIASGDPTDLYAAIARSAVPVAVWVGPSGADAFGGAAQLLTSAGFTGAAPGSRIGYLGQTIAGGPVHDVPVVPGMDPVTMDRIVEGVIGITEPVPGLVDVVSPTIGNFIADLDGAEIPTAAGPVVLDTTMDDVTDDGLEIVVPTAEVRFLKPDLVTRTLRLAIRPEAMLFFLLAGLTAAAFEFYAAGAGIGAAVAALSLFFAAFGVASLPMNWVALTAVLVGMVLYTVDFQNAVISWRALLGTAALLIGGLNITAAAPQFSARWWAVVLVVVGVAAFYMVALTTVARSRFSTRTIGRTHLVGRRGVAQTDFDPMGIVDVDGARWQARSHRAAGLGPGDDVEVLEVKGIMLEVGPVEPLPGAVRD